MTNQNPAVPQPNSSKLDRDILAKVNAHADRSLDRLFADIEELLSGDLETDPQSLQITHSQSAPAATEPSHTEPARQHQQQQPPSYPPQSQFVPAQPSPVEFEQPIPTAAPKQRKKGLPLWLKVLLGLGATSIALGGGLLWLINERKIELPKNIDTSWLPFQSRSQVSPEDAKFADYMRKSISKIESANTLTSATTPVNAAAPAPAANPPTGAATVPVRFTKSEEALPLQGRVSLTPTAVKDSIALVKTIQSSVRPSAIFQIDRQHRIVNVGQKVGTSDWSLLSIAKGQVILKRKGGEIRSISVGQKF
jgi:hypothetical protein